MKKLLTGTCLLVCLLLLAGCDSSNTTTVPTQEPAASTSAPTQEPSKEPTTAPTDTPTPAPTSEPTDTPTPAPTSEPTDTPTPEPTQEPTDVPDDTPTVESKILAYILENKIPTFGIWGSLADDYQTTFDDGFCLMKNYDDTRTDVRFTATLADSDDANGTGWGGWFHHTSTTMSIDEWVFLPYMYKSDDGRYYIWAYSDWADYRMEYVGEGNAAEEVVYYTCHKCYWDGKVYYKSMLDTDGTTVEYIVCNFISDEPIDDFGMEYLTVNYFNGSNWHFEQNTDYLSDEGYTCYTVLK